MLRAAAFPAWNFKAIISVAFAAFFACATVCVCECVCHTHCLPLSLSLCRLLCVCFALRCLAASSFLFYFIQYNSSPCPAAVLHTPPPFHHASTTCPPPSLPLSALPLPTHGTTWGRSCSFCDCFLAISFFANAAGLYLHYSARRGATGAVQKGAVQLTTS